MPPWRQPPPEVVGSCPPHRIQWVDGRAVWMRVCPDCALAQNSTQGPILYWSHYCHRALGRTVIAVWWPNERFERTNYMGKPVKFCKTCGGSGCKDCGGTGTTG